MPWIETGVLTRPDLRRLDEAAYNGLRNWLSLPGNSLESVGLSIPTKSEALRLQKINLPEEERARLEERLRYHRKEVSRISRILGLM
jgi:regulator of protease activity HflC (stomatin/prohibitin superfamily)